jgi:hypothetical protein
MSIQFRIFDEELSDAAMDLEDQKVYRVGNSIEFDIYTAALPASEEGPYFFDLAVKGQSISFSQASDTIKHLDFVTHREMQAQLNSTYKMPCLFEFMGLKFAICDGSFSYEKWLTLLEIKPPPEAPKPTLDNLEMSPEEMKLLEKASPKKIPPIATSIFYDWTQKVLTFLKTKKSLPTLKFDARMKKVFIWSTAGAFCLVLILITFFAYEKYSLQKDSHNQSVANLDDLQAIKQIQVNLPPQFNELKFITNQNDLVVIMGVVKDQDEINYIKLKFKNYSRIVHIKLLTAPQAISKLKTLLDSINVRFVTPEFNSKTYRISLVGMMKSLDAINDIEIAVSVHLPEVSDMDTTRIFAFDTVEKDVDALLAPYSASRNIVVKKDLNARLVTIKGFLNQDEMESLKLGASDLMAKYDNFFKIETDLKNVTLTLPFKIVAVSTGGLPSFMTDTGRKVFEGTVIEGLKVDRITSTEIVFSGKFPMTLKLDDALGFNGVTQK